MIVLTTFSLGIWNKKISMFLPDLPGVKVESKLLKATKWANGTSQEAKLRLFSATPAPRNSTTHCHAKSYRNDREEIYVSGDLPSIAPFLWCFQPTFLFWVTRPLGKACKACIQHASQHPAQERPQHPNTRRQLGNCTRRDSTAGGGTWEALLRGWSPS